MKVLNAEEQRKLKGKSLKDLHAKFEQLQKENQELRNTLSLRQKEGTTIELSRNENFHSEKDAENSENDYSDGEEKDRSIRNTFSKKAINIQKDIFSSKNLNAQQSRKSTRTRKLKKLD